MIMITILVTFVERLFSGQHFYYYMAQKYIRSQHAGGVMDLLTNSHLIIDCDKKGSTIEPFIDQ